MTTTTKYYNILFIVCIIIILLALFTNTQQQTNIGKEGLKPTEYIQSPATPLFLGQPQPLGSNLGVTFTVLLKSGHNGYWQQILGITPSSTDYDQRILGVWLHPYEDKIHIRTATTYSDNDEITDAYGPLPLNKEMRFDVILNKIPGNKQRAELYLDNKLVIRKFLAPAIYAPERGYNKYYLYTSYQNYTGLNIINGTVQNITVITNNTEITKINQDQGVNFGVSQAVDFQNKLQQGKDPTKSSFTTMEQSLIEGLGDMGGMGYNGGISSFTPPTDGIKSPEIVKPATNYKPITKKNPADVYNPIQLCKTSVVQPTDRNIDKIRGTGYNYPLTGYPNPDGSAPIGASDSVPICSPDDLYQIQTKILDEINAFNLEYAEFITYMYNKKYKGYSPPGSPPGTNITPPLPYPTNSSIKTDENAAASPISSISNVSDLTSYQNLISDLQTYNKLIWANQQYYSDPEITPATTQSKLTDPLSKIDPELLGSKHKEILKFRSDLDKKLFELNNVQNSAAGESKMQMDSSIYVTILWTTLATSVIYFMFL